MNGHISLGQILAGQKALVTGANSGIGAAVAKALAEAGAAVAINYVSNPDKTEALLAEIREAGGTAIGVHADVSQEDQVQAMFKEVIGAFGTLDILINNAGLQRDAFIHDMSLADWNFVIAVNLTGQFLCAREAVREFMHRRCTAVAVARPARSSACPRCTTAFPGPAIPITRPPRAASCC